MARKHEISRLIEAGQEFLQKGEFKKAAASFKKLLEMGEDAAARNNLALSYYHSGQLKQALNALQPNLRQNPQSPLCYPYAYSLGVMILLEMGRQSEARSYMDKALQGYGDSSAQLALQREVFDPEGEYLSMMMEAAGLLGDHAMVLDLFQRWARPSSLWKCHHLAATACFNRGDLPSAAYHWGQIRLQSGYFDELSRLAILIAHEGYPLFELEYREMSEEETLEMASHAFTDAQVKTRLGQSGYYKIRLMLMLLDETHFDLDQRQMAATALIVWTGDWGRAYGRMLMGSRDLPMETKGAVAAALMDIGELGDGENMLLNVDGRDTEVIYKTIQVDVSPEQEAIYEEGWQMIDQGQNTGAITLWEEQIRGQGKLYPPILLDLIQLYAREGRMREAEAYYGILHEIGRQKPEEYELDLVMAQTYIAAGREDYDEAQRCMKRFIQIGDEMKEEDRYVERTFRLILGMLDEVFGTDNESGMRKEIENKDLPVNPTILRGLKNMPVIWLDEICIKLGIERLRLRKERENRIAAMLQDPDFLVTVLASLSPDEKALLKSLLDRGGWSPLNVMTRKYGTLDGESYYWPEKGTCTVPGGVWSRGLAMVGKAIVKDRRQKIITIPVELRTVMLYAFRILELKGRYDGQPEQDGQPEPPEQMEQPGLPLWKEKPAGGSKVVALRDSEGSETVKKRWLIMASGILYYYGAMRLEDLYGQISVIEGPGLSKEQFRSLVKAEAGSPDGDYRFVCEKNIAYFGEAKDHKHILREQALRREIPFRPVTFQEASLVVEEQEYRLWSKPVQNLFQWMKRKWLHTSPRSIVDMEVRLEIRGLMADVRNDLDFQALMGRTMESLNIACEKDFRKTSDYLIGALNNIPLWVLKGWTPEEVRKRELAGAPATFNQKEISWQRYAWEDDASIQDSSIGAARKETAGERMEKTGRTEKIGRNDLCPCKSGKKYKHCCGRDV